jgi:hypothetical protein
LKKYQFKDVIKNETSGFDYISSLLFRAFEHNEEGLKALKLLYETMTTIDIGTYANARNKPDLTYYTFLSYIAVDIYESEVFKKSFLILLYT